MGGGNSAGQAAMFLSRHAAHVHILVRGAGLAATMSDYLVQRISQSPRCTLHPFSAITGLEGDTRLRKVTWTGIDGEGSQTRLVGNVFVMIGAAPNTAWLDGAPLSGVGRAGFRENGPRRQWCALSLPLYDDAAWYLRRRQRRSLGLGQTRRRFGRGEGSVVVAAIHQFLHPDA